MEVQIKSGGPELRKQLSVAQLNHAVTTLVEEASRIAWTRAHNKAPGHIAASIQATVSASGYEGKVFSLLPEAQYVDTGRKPGGPLPPPRALEAWMSRHGFNGSSFVLARAIARRGVRGRFFMRAARGAVVGARNRLSRLFAEAWKV